METASGGEAALEKITAHGPFAVVVSDRQMPGMDGYAATALLRRHGWERPIVALTAHAMLGQQQECLAAGCNDYLPKPVSRATLLTKLASYLVR